ncbi:MAG: hypothetical protein ABEJ23_04480 [Haloarculaceae archaeon]
MASFFGQLIGSVFDLVATFGTVATHDPISALLMLVSAVLFVFAVGVFGVLTIGAILSLFRPESLDRATRQPE